MKYEATIHEAWALHELFRRLGFEPDEIFFVQDARHPNGQPSPCGVAVRRYGEEFVVTLPALAGEAIEPSAIADAWREFSAGLARMSDETLGDIWVRSLAKKMINIVLAHLHEHRPRLARDVMAKIAKVSAH